MHPREREDKLNQWLDRHKGLLIKVARSFSQSSHDHDDLLQEISFQVWESIPRYNPAVAETTWLYRVALYTAISWSRKHKVHEQRTLDIGTHPLPSADDHSDADPRTQWLYDKIAELKPIDRSLTLLLLDGFSYRAMAETLGISESNVGVRINRIKKKLTRQLAVEKQHEL